MRLRIPGIIDLVTIGDRAAIREISENPVLDRQFVSAGPLINRLLLSRVCRAMTTDGKRLPSIAPRDDPERSKGQAALQRRLDELSGGNIADSETLQALADAIRGKADAPSIAIATQQAVGRWFVPDYFANARTWKAACELQAAVNSRNPFYVFYLFVSGTMRRAQHSLSRRVDGDRAGVHATGIAVHNVVRGFEAMQHVWRDVRLGRRLSIDAVLGRCLVAPAVVLRQATAKAALSAGDVRRGTLVLMSLEVARSRDPGADLSFLSQSWSHCPASAAVVELFRAVWLKLNADGASHD